MRWLGRKWRTLRNVAYRAQFAIVSSPGHAHWTASWSGTPPRYRLDPADMLYTITGPLLTDSQVIDDALAAVRACIPPSELVDLVDRARIQLARLLMLRPDWIAFVASRQDSGLSPEQWEAELGADLHFNGRLIGKWAHEEVAVSAALAVLPLLDEVHQALVPYSGVNWVAGSAR